VKFQYQARNQQGQLQVGNVEAPDKKAAVQILTGHNLYVLSIESAKQQSISERVVRAFNRVKAKDLMVFTRQLATLIESEMPLDNALQSLYRQTKNTLLKESIFGIIQDIESGLSLSQALERQKPIFSEFYVSMIRSAEVTGRLEEAMQFLADYMEKEAQWRSKMVSALIYPIILLALFIVVALVMVVVVFPKIAPVFQESGVELPFITTALLSSGQFILQWWWVFVLVLIGFVFIAIDYLKSREGRAVMSQFILVMPVFGTLFKKIYITRFARSFGVLIKGGIPMTQAIEIAADTIGNVIYRELLSAIAQGVREGAMFSQLLVQETKYFPVMVGQMAAVGESTGRLEQMMGRVASFYDEEINDTMANLGELIQPMLILVIGLLVGLLFASILLPIYNLAQSFQI
jgi:type IV pilus assembly protein PilC